MNKSIFYLMRNFCSASSEIAVRISQAVPWQPCAVAATGATVAGVASYFGMPTDIVLGILVASTGGALASAFYHLGTKPFEPMEINYWSAEPSPMLGKVIVEASKLLEQARSLAGAANNGTASLQQQFTMRDAAKNFLMLVKETTLQTRSQAQAERDRLRHYHQDTARYLRELEGELEKGGYYTARVVTEHGRLRPTAVGHLKVCEGGRLLPP